MDYDFLTPMEQMEANFPVGSHWTLSAPFHMFRSDREYEVTGYGDMAAIQSTDPYTSVCFFTLFVRPVLSGFEISEAVAGRDVILHAIGPFDFSKHFTRAHRGELHRESEAPSFDEPPRREPEPAKPEFEKQGL